MPIMESMRLPAMGLVNELKAGLVSGPPPSKAVNNGGTTTAGILFGGPFEARDELDDRHDRCLAYLNGLTAGKSAKDALDQLTSAMSRDSRSHDDICVGFVVAILTAADEQAASGHWRDLTRSSRDGLALVVNHATSIVLEKYHRMTPAARHQLLWLVRELVRASVAGTDSLVWNLMRQIAGGDVSRNNLWLADSLADILADNRAWLDKFPFLVASVAYTYLRIVEDHVAPSLEKLREKEVRFVVGLVRDRFADVTAIGRDLVRVLQYVAKVPEIDALWRDILTAPKTLSPGFTGLGQLMETRTSRRFLQCRVTPEMEKKMVFLTSQVKFGSHKRYQDWFQRQYLGSAESQSLRCDLIRFIVGVIHPTNELLCSDIIPRWAVIGWLLTTCTNQMAASNAKLALFYDWLYFDPERDNIMNIEPAILVMHHSIKPHPAITATLLDFLCRIVVHFDPANREKVRNGVYSSLRQILEKRVLPSLGPLLDNARLDDDLRCLLAENFAPFLNEDAVKAENDEHFDESESLTPTAAFSDDDEEDGEKAAFEPVAEPAKPASKKKDDTGKKRDDSKKPDDMGKKRDDTVKKPDETGKKRDDTGKKPDDTGKKRDDSSSGLASTRRRRKRRLPRPADAQPGSNTEPVDLGPRVGQLLADLGSSPGERDRRAVMESLVGHVLAEDEDSFGYEQCASLAKKLSPVLEQAGQFSGKIFPAGRADDDEALAESVASPLFVIFRSLVSCRNEPSGEAVLLSLLAELYALQPRVGYYLLHYLSVDKDNGGPAAPSAYRDLCETIDANFSLDLCLVNDMRQCRDDDVEMFVHLAAGFVFTNFDVVGNVDLIYLVASCADAGHVLCFVSRVLARRFVMFKRDGLEAVIRASFGWETFEQFVLWQLLLAHADLPIVDVVVGLLPKMAANPEAVTAAMLRLRSERPTADLLRQLFAASPSVVAPILANWIYADSHREKLADHVAAHVTRACANNNAGKLPRRAEIALGHLEGVRLASAAARDRRAPDDFFGRLAGVLGSARGLCNDAQKKRFHELFALADDDDDDEDDDDDDDDEVVFRHNSRNVSTSSDGGDDGEDEAKSSRAKKKSSSSSSSGNKSRKRTNKVSSYKELVSSSSDNDDVNPPTAKKRRRAKTSAPVNSDSD